MNDSNPGFRSLRRFAVVATLAGGAMVGLAGFTAPDASYIEGRLTDESGRPVGDACVYVDAGSRLGGVAKSDEIGRYSIIGLAAGSYYVQFASCEGTIHKNLAVDHASTTIYESR